MQRRYTARGPSHSLLHVTKVHMPLDSVMQLRPGIGEARGPELLIHATPYSCLCQDDTVDTLEDSNTAA